MSEYSLTDEVKRVFHIAQAIAREYGHSYFSSEHLLKALLHNDIGLRTHLSEKGKDIYYLEEWAEVRLEACPKSGRRETTVRGDEKVEVIMDEANNFRIKSGKDLLDPLCLLAALSTPGLGFSYDQLKTLPLNPNELLNGEEKKRENQLYQTANAAKNITSPEITSLHKFCKDKTASAREGKLDEIIGRDRETRMISEILCRRLKPNVIIVGDPGVGKTALVDSFALNIINNSVPERLKNAIIFELDFGSLIAGASYKGEIEDRLKGILKEVKLFEKAILFIDEIHLLMDKQGGAAGAANLLKPELARGEITIIGATTQDEYRKFIETDEAFSRRFEVLKVEEPSEETAIRMLNRIVPYYEQHHGLSIDTDAVADAVRLSKRYIKDRRLPDAAIDLIDRTMAIVKLSGETSQAQLEQLTEDFENLTRHIQTYTPEEQSKELNWFYLQLKNKVSFVLYGQLEEENSGALSGDPLGFANYIRGLLKKLFGFSQTRTEQVQRTDIAAVVASKTGIPIGKIQRQERNRLLNIEGFLQKRVIGQEQAIKAISAAVLESRSGLSKKGCPIGSFFLLGPTGTGKTELAKSLAEFLFSDESALLRFDMSEFKEEHSAALLYGAPPGYVGYEEGGLLVNKIRQQPYSVVLFDEIEKAHSSIFDLFLQILDEGKLHDRLGKEGDFSNSVILFTSNIGSEYITGKLKDNNMPSPSELLEIMQQYFRPEFLGRLTEIVPFAPINVKNIVQIFDKQLEHLLSALAQQGIGLKVNQAAKDYLAQTGFTPKYGARPLTGVIRNQLRRPLSRMIISGKVRKGSFVEVDLNEQGELNWIVNEEAVLA